VVKLNTDASFLSESGQSWAGAVARNHNGQVFFSMSSSLNKCTQVEEAEAAAALLGLNHLSTLYKGHVILEIDCANLAKDLIPGALTKPAWFHYICDIKAMWQSFQSVKICCVGRRKNNLAHELASYGRHKLNHISVGTVPVDLLFAQKTDCDVLLE